MIQEKMLSIVSDLQVIRWKFRKNSAVATKTNVGVYYSDMPQYNAVLI